MYACVLLLSSIAPPSSIDLQYICLRGSSPDMICFTRAGARECVCMFFFSVFIATTDMCYCIRGAGYCSFLSLIFLLACTLSIEEEWWYLVVVGQCCFLRLSHVFSFYSSDDDARLVFMHSVGDLVPTLESKVFLKKH